MHNIDDILLKSSLTGEEVRKLNFLGSSTDLFYRKYYRQGLRSHIFEVLSAKDVFKEREGEIVDGVRCYPRAKPKHVLRILRTRFQTVDKVLDEIKKYGLVLKYLGPGLIAKSNEFIVDYTGSGKSEIVLCGLQEYVEGAILDPWALFGQNPLDNFYISRFSSEVPKSKWMLKARKSIETFVERTREMIIDSGHIPDLAGNGNLILTKNGNIRLVDINNILKVHYNDTISVDDKGYPACDKSIEVLVLIEQKILKNKDLKKDSLYAHFLLADRIEKVKRLEVHFFQNLRQLSIPKNGHKEELPGRTDNEFI